MRITLYLLRPEADFGKGVLRDASRYSEVEVMSSDEVEWQLFVNPGAPREASWVDGVRPIVTDAGAKKLGKLKYQSSAGVLLVKSGDRIFAVTFGQGYHALDYKVLEPGFGLRVTANVVAADKLTGADTKGLTKSAKSQKTNAARG
jgi:uncharacterized protein (TIGR04141 family)